MAANIKIGSESKQLQNDLKSVVSNLKAVSSELSVSTERAKLFGNATDKMRASQAEISNVLRGNRTILSSQKSIINSLTSDINKYTQRNQELSKSISNLDTKLKEQIKETGEESKEVKELQRDLSKLQSEYEANNRAIDKANGQMSNYRTKINDTEKAIMNNQKALQDLNKELATAKWDNISQKANKFGDGLNKYVSLPLIAGGTAATKMALDYEKSFAKVSTLLDSSKVDYDKYKNDILKASTETGVAVDDFSESVYSSISAGQDQANAIGFTTTAMKLAKGGFTDGAKAVDVLTTALNGYKLKSEDANKVSDILVTTQNLGKTTVDELASSMGAVIPIASAANFGIDELGTAYAEMTAKGIATAETGTYMKSMLSELTKSGSLTDKALKKLTGEGFAKLKSEGKSTSDILNLLDGYAKNNKISLKDMFGSVEAGTAAMVLSGNKGEDFNNILKQMQDSAGATQSAFDKMDSTKAEQMKKSLNKLKTRALK